MNVKIGDKVSVDTILAALEQSSLPREVLLAGAQREIERLKNGPSADDIAAAEARVAAAQSALNQSNISAPFDNVITQARLFPGDLVSPGTLAFRIEILSRLLIDMELSEVDINSIATVFCSCRKQ
ncbi:MAG: hypothetical protein NTW32_12480 [Chloroflexi bacterium]|nr:hypothetical protein [Chloroflexota bacterium]